MTKYWVCRHPFPGRNFVIAGANETFMSGLTYQAILEHRRRYGCLREMTRVEVEP